MSDLSAEVAGSESNTEVHVCLRLEAHERLAATDFLSKQGLRATFLDGGEELRQRLGECVFLLMGRPPRVDYAPAAKLELLQIAGTGVDPLFPLVGLRNETWISNCRGMHADSVRDHVFASMLAFARGLPRALTQQSRREWRAVDPDPVSGKHLVILGYGAIGSRVAAVAAAFGLRVSAVCRTARGAPELHRLFTTDDLTEAVKDADYFVIAVPLTSSTRGLVGAAVIQTLPPHAVVINVARGGILDQAALESALRAGRLGGAALDVFDEEPLPRTSTLWDCPRLLVTPHVAGCEPQYVRKVFEHFAENVRRIIRGEPPLSSVSRVHEY